MTKVTLITGSTMGSAEYVAEHIAEILEKLVSTLKLHMVHP